jgi:sugar lactone lactonase YvrE
VQTNGIGSQNGSRQKASFFQPEGLAIDASGTLYVSDTKNHRIRKITRDSPGSAFSGTLTDGGVSTLAGDLSGYQDATASAARFFLPTGLALGPDGTLYVADQGNHRIRMVSAAGVVTTLAGSSPGLTEGTGDNAQFDNPRGVAVDNDGTVYVADTNNHRIRRISSTGVVTTFAGSTEGFADGVGNAAQFSFPRALCINASGTLYVADSFNSRIRAITPEGVVSTLAGSTAGNQDGTGPAAQISNPSAICVAPSGTIYVWGERLCRVTPDGTLTTLAGENETECYRNAVGAAARFRNVLGLAVTASETLYVADTNNHTLRVVR